MCAGLGALRAAGLDTSHLFPLLACLRHSPNGKYQSAMIEPQPGTVLAFERSGECIWERETCGRRGQAMVGEGRVMRCAVLVCLHHLHNSKRHLRAEVSAWEA